MSAEKSNVAVSFRWNPHVASRTLQGTAFVLLNSRMVRLNDVGTRIWERFEHGATVREVVSQVISEFETSAEEATPDVSDLVDQLVTKGMLVPA